ncbi:MAG: hypothetical protein J5809_05535 [Selenomonadaceae bacterium]|nr:hypothetical protein [Selenomonadaceae bacterium]
MATAFHRTKLRRSSCPTLRTKYTRPATTTRLMRRFSFGTKKNLARAIYYFSKSGEWFYIGEIYRRAGDFDAAGKWYAKYF